jgi:hypothetical protein
MSGKKYYYYGGRERYWMGMENYLQDHNLSESHPLIAFWV